MSAEQPRRCRASPHVYAVDRMLYGQNRRKGMFDVVILPLFTHEFVKSGFFSWVRFFIQMRTLHVGNDPLIGDEKPYTSKVIWLF